MNIFNAEGAKVQRCRGVLKMPGGMGKMELCFLASLLLCDNVFNAEGAEEQRKRNSATLR
jgi:hypothetical protein